MMNRIVIIVALLICILATSSRSVAQAESQAKISIQGTWELIKGSGFKKPVLHVRSITATHDSWVFYDAKREKPLATAGGRYKLVGETYTIKFDYASEGYGHLIGRQHTLTYRVEEGLLRVTGNLAGGEKIDQTWKRYE